MPSRMALTGYTTPTSVSFPYSPLMSATTCSAGQRSTGSECRDDETGSRTGGGSLASPDRAKRMSVIGTKRRITVLSPTVAFGGKADMHDGEASTAWSRLDQNGHWLAFYVAARSESQLYQNICLSRYDAVSSAAGGWPVNGAPPFSLPDARRQHRGSSVSPRGRPS